MNQQPSAASDSPLAPLRNWEEVSRLYNSMNPGARTSRRTVMITATEALQKLRRKHPELMNYLETSGTFPLATQSRRSATHG